MIGESTIQTIKLDDYMLERLRNLNKEIHPEEGEDFTITIGVLIAKHDIYDKIKDMMR